MTWFIASVAGERTAHQLVRDGFSSARYPCTDLNTLILAVLRHHGIACRLARYVVNDFGQSSAVEFHLNGREYWDQFVRRRRGKLGACRFV
ncbi:MAG: hypothetical protein Q8P02_02330 [Candidatus Micrarchaeota archaeon]|nr:hypothetical protein [Candidatus Micrarchaeota archaeon]